MSKDFSELVGEALGKASMAWSETPSGIFDSDTCCVLHIDIMNAHNKEIYKLKSENAKLRECVEFYADLDNEVDFYDSRGMSYARQVLKELEEK